jgi:site-specific recombinase XerD
MTNAGSWKQSPARAYAEWQQQEALGADRRPFAARSIVQHRAMFERFHRYLASRKVSLAGFGSDHLEGFFAEISRGFQPGTTTRLRYIKLIDRLCRHLMEIGVRHSNPAFQLLQFEAWPDSEPVPLFLPPEVDVRLQRWVKPRARDDALARRARAVVALLLATGITAAELRYARVSALRTNGGRPYFHVDARVNKDGRTIGLDRFGIVPLDAWQRERIVEANDDVSLFPSERSDILPMRTLHRIVSNALQEIGFGAPDMSPRVLRNTFARRHLLNGRSNEEVSRMLGLASQRTAVRLRQTLEASSGASDAFRV